MKKILSRWTRLYRSAPFQLRMPLLLVWLCFSLLPLYGQGAGKLKPVALKPPGSTRLVAPVIPAELGIFI